MNQPTKPARGYQSRVLSSSLRLMGWSVAWVAATALMKFGPKFLWSQDSVFTLLAIGLNVAVGIGMIMANRSYLAGLDEVQQKVHLNALGITVGVALIVGVPFTVMDLYRVISFHAQIWHLLLLMSLTFMGSVLYGTWRYR